MKNLTNTETNIIAGGVNTNLGIAAAVADDQAMAAGVALMEQEIARFFGDGRKLLIVTAPLMIIVLGLSTVAALRSNNKIFQKNDSKVT